jgi:hypothetical protein
MDHKTYSASFHAVPKRQLNTCYLIMSIIITICIIFMLYYMGVFGGTVMSGIFPFLCTLQATLAICAWYIYCRDTMPVVVTTKDDMPVKIKKHKKHNKDHFYPVYRHTSTTQPPAQPQAPLNFNTTGGHDLTPR